MRQLSRGVLAWTTVAGLAGCSPLSLAKHGFAELRGAHGKIYAVSDAPAAFYEGLSGINIDEVRNTIEPVCSHQFAQMIEIALREEAAEASEDLVGAGGPCTVKVDISFNKEAGGATALIGKGALLIGRAAVLDTDAKQTADLLVVVASSAVRTGDQEVADEFAKTLVGYLRKKTDDRAG